METLFIAIVTQALTFLPLALGISISYLLLRATDMTLDGSFILGAGVFAKLISLGVSPLIAAFFALLSGALAGVMVSLIQKGGRVDPLLAGILASFILNSGNLLIMGRPNINLLSAHTLVSDAFAKSNLDGWMLISLLCGLCCGAVILILRSPLGLLLRALGDNPALLQRLGKPIELLRMTGFALTNLLSAAAGLLTAQTVGYADVGMSFGMTLTGIGAIILGQQILRFFYGAHLRIAGEFIACLIGVLIYFFAINTLLRFDIDPVYLKMTIGLILILFLRSALNIKKGIPT